ncbi:MAG: hypothetical protein ACRECO_11830 [Xanthobacteraceae bacterium]
MARYTPGLIAHVRHRYENTDDTLAKIAADCGVSERGVHRMRDREGWTRRSDRPPRDLPPAMQALKEATALLATRHCERSDSAATPMTPTPTLPLSGGGSTQSAPLGTRDTASPPGDGISNAVERIERLVEQELTAEEAVRAQLGPLPRPPAEAERSARTLAVLTQTLHALQRLRCGLSPDSGSTDDDDMPRDIDEFRHELARRIDAFVASRTERRDADGDSKPAVVDAAG